MLTNKQQLVFETSVLGWVERDAVIDVRLEGLQVCFVVLV